VCNDPHHPPPTPNRFCYLFENWNRLRAFGRPGFLRLAVARALVKIDESHRRKLRDLGLLTRDARAVERKKPGRPKARKRFQFSKR